MESTLLKMNVELPENWEKIEDSYTGNDVIDAYLAGIKVGKDNSKKITTEKLQGNIYQATQVSEKLKDKAFERNIHFQSILLKADTISVFTALIVTSLEDYLSDDFLTIYRLANQLKIEVQSPNFNIFFSFTHNSPMPSRDRLAADGFFLRYEKEPRDAEPRNSQ